jgi:myo-inositol-1(or 4)-monophosphatase
MEPLLSTALRAAEAAAGVQLSRFREMSVESAEEKGRSDFVTAVDLEAQRAAMAVIRDDFPHHRFLAEEEEGDPGASPPEPGRSEPPGAAAEETDRNGGGPQVRRWPEDGGHLWIIDPLDGTTNYLHRHPMFAASVAVGRGGAKEASEGKNPGLRFQGLLEAGAVVAPRTQERWWARRGGGAWKNGRRIRVSGIQRMNRALVGTGFPFKRPDLVPRHARQLQEVLLHSAGVRRGGSAALDLCYLSEGILDCFWEEAYLSPWDSAAGLLILSEAGGTACRIDGTHIDLENGSILAGNSRELLERLASLLNSSG